MGNWVRINSKFLTHLVYTLLMQYRGYTSHSVIFVSINIQNTTTQRFFNRLNISSVFKFEEVKEQFILDNLHKIDVKKAAELDNIEPRLLKDSVNVIARPLRKIINVSLQ